MIVATTFALSALACTGTEVGRDPLTGETPDAAVATESPDAPPSEMSLLWPNEPADFGAVLDCPFDSVEGCGILDVYASSEIVTDDTAPTADRHVVKSTIHAGHREGGMQLSYATSELYREMYVGIRWRTNPGFEGRAIGNKTFFVRGPEQNGVFLFGDGALVDGGAPMIFRPNSANVDNGHTCAANGLQCVPNAGPGLLAVGEWTLLEAYIKASTSSTSRDGVVRWWINGELAGEYTDMNYGAGGLNEWMWSETWDGLVDPAPTVDWTHYLDHLHLSAR